jgi:hypothetical protein
MSLIFENAFLQKNTAPAIPEISTETPYASLSLHALEFKMISSAILFHFMIDRSGSMGDKCSDGRTKMEHTLHTLRNALHLFASNSEAEIYVKVDAFDDVVEDIFGPVQVTQDNIPELIEIINKEIFSRNSTNIEEALNHSSRFIQSYKETNSFHRVAHIFMTDGDATMGNKNPDELAALANVDVSSSFIAFGIQHDAQLMNKLGQSSEKSSNWLIEKLENAGLVYGEIVNNELYVGAQDVVIQVTDGKIYDYISGEFVTELKVGQIVSQTQKNYHVLCENDSCELVVRAKIVSTGEVFEELVSLLPDLLDVNNNLVPNDLTDHMFRLKTQQLLHEVMHFQYNDTSLRPFAPLARNLFSPVDLAPRSPAIVRQNAFNPQTDLTQEQEYLPIPPPRIIEEPPLSCLKKKLSDFHKILMDQQKDGKENLFMKTLSDDIYIAIRSLGTRYQQMYVGARESSQGRQRTYNVADLHFNDHEVDVSLPRYQLNRSATNGVYSTPRALTTMNTLSQDPGTVSSPFSPPQSSDSISTQPY